MIRRLLSRFVLVAAFVAIPLGPGLVAAPVADALGFCSHYYLTNTPDRAYARCATNDGPIRAIQAIVKCTGHGDYLYSGKVLTTAIGFMGTQYVSVAVCPYPSLVTWYSYRYWR